jgi:hypothetical protein
MEMLIMALLSSFTFIQGVVDAPPRDFASLLQAKAVLEQMNVTTDEATLITLIATDATVKIGEMRLKQAINDLQSEDRQARKMAEMLLDAAGDAAIPHLEKAVKSTDPEVKVTAQNLLRGIQQKRMAEARNNTGYVKKLMAIRALQDMKSKNALPALAVIAKGGNPTLSDAAQTAVAIINGQEPKRTTGAATLKQVMTRLPMNVGFVAVLDMEKGSNPRTINAFVADIQKQLEAEKNPQAKQVAPMMAAMMPQIQKGMVQAIGMTGNIRIDSITVLTTADMATGPGNDDGAAAFIFKGLHDPAMMTNLLKQNRRIKEMKYKKDTVLYQHDVAFCSVDKNTFVIAVSEANDGSQIYAFLDAWHEQPNKILPMHKVAFDAVIAGKGRLAVGGAMSDAQKAISRPEIQRELQRMKNRPNRGPEHAVQVAMLDMVVAAIDAKSYVGHIDPKLSIVIEATCKDAADAKAMADKLTKMDKAMRDVINDGLAKMKNQGGADQMFSAMLKNMDFKKPFFESEANADKATGKCDFSRLMSMGILSVMSMGVQAQPVQMKQAPRARRPAQ